MCSRAHWPIVALGAALAAGCGPSDGPLALTPALERVEPSCGDSAAATAVAVLGSMPVKPELSMSGGENRIDASYRAWLGQVELGEVTWSGAQRLTAKVPAGLAPGVYSFTVQSPFGTRSSKEAAFEVRQGACPVQGAVLAITSTAAPATVVVGQQVTVTATVRNGGRATAAAVTATVASAPSGLAPTTAPTGPQDVPGGEERSFTWTYTATDPGGGAFAIDAAGTSGDSGLPVAAPRASSNAVLVNPATFLTANTEVTPSRVNVGQSITVALTVTNHATAAALATPSVAVVGLGTTVSAGNVPVALSIAGGSAHTFVWTYTARAAGEASFTASVSGRDPVGGQLVTVPTAQVNVSVQTAARLSATLAIPPAIELGDFTVTMTVTNSGGPSAAAVDAVVPDLPAPQAGSTADVVLRSGPTGAPATVAAGQPAATFSWVFTARAAGPLTLGSTARGTDANSGAPVASNLATSAAAVALHTVGGSITGLVGSVVLHLGAESLTVSADGPYRFPTPLGTGAAYAVSVTAHPTGPSQTCTVASATGTIAAADVADVAVTCTTDSFTLGGAVAGLVGSVVLSNGGENLTVTTNGPFTFQTRVASGATYAVGAVHQGSPSQTCLVSNGSGTMGAAAVSNVSVTCATESFTVGGTVTGLVGSVVLSNGGEDLTVTVNGPFTFATRVASGATYAIGAVHQGSPSQTCLVSNGSGTMGAAAVSNVSVTCATDSFTVGGAVSGLAGSVVLSNGGESLTVAANGPFTFPTPVASGATYAVGAVHQGSPSQTCLVSNGSGTMGAAAVSNVSVSCSTLTFTLGGSISGLTGSGLTLADGGATLAVAAGATSYAFPAPLASGTLYAVSVSVQPTAPSQTCTVANAAGTIGGADVANANVSCTTRSFLIHVTVAGLAAGNALTLRQSGGDDLSAPADGAYTFATPVPSAEVYAVSVAAQTAVTPQACDVIGGDNGTGGGVMGTADVTVTVTCL